jgi:hypothetical protein
VSPTHGRQDLALACALRRGDRVDLRAPGPVADEVERLKALGASVIRVDDWLTVMADPEGNEFCVE